MEAAGLPTPRHRLLSPKATAEDLQAAGTYVGYPAVLKPTGGAASLGCMVVDSPFELAMSFERCVSDMSRECVAGLGTFIHLVPGETAPEGSWALNSELMLEEYLAGDEVDCDIIMHNGIVVYTCISDNWPKKSPGATKRETIVLPCSLRTSKKRSQPSAPRPFVHSVFQLGRSTSRP